MQGSAASIDMKPKKIRRPVAVVTFIFAVLTSVVAATREPGPSTAPVSDIGQNVGMISPQIFVTLAKKMMPSVVNISTLTVLKDVGPQGGTEDLFQWFFGEMVRPHGRGPGIRRHPQHQPKAMALGTGFVIDSNGLILTNNHVVQDADEIKISFTEASDEKPLDAEVVGRDPETDIAVIKVKTKRTLTPVTLGDSENIEVGEFVMALGNPFGHGHSVTHGIISAKGRTAPDFPLLANYLQTDAPINPGNSGGPLVNMRGEVIGINNAIDQRAQGIGFAIPINVAKKVLPQLSTKGSVSRGYIGVAVRPLSSELSPKLNLPKDQQGVLVVHVYPNEPAELAKIKPYDIILEFNGKSIKNDVELIHSVASVDIGKTVPIKVLRNGKSLILQIKVGLRPNSQTLAQSRKPPHSKRPPSSIDLGMNIQEVTPDIAQELGLPKGELPGVVVESVTYGGPADRAGVIRGDILLEVDQKPIEDLDSFYSMINQKKSYLVRVRRMDPQGGDSFHVFVLDLKS